MGIIQSITSNIIENLDKFPRNYTVSEEANKQSEPQLTLQAELSKTVNQKVYEETVGKVSHYKIFKWLFLPDGKTLINGWLAIVFFILVFGIGGYGVKSYFADLKYSDLNGKYQDAKQDRDKYQIMLAPFEAAAIKLNTNSPVEERLHLFSDQMLTISTNFFAAIEADKPKLELFVNGVKILTTNDTTIDLKNSRQLVLSAQNISTIAADNVEFSFYTPPELAPENLTFGASWSAEPRTFQIKDNVITTNLLGYHWIFLSDMTVGGGEMHLANPIDISTNIIYSAIRVYASISATRAETKMYSLVLSFQ